MSTTTITPTATAAATSVDVSCLHCGQLRDAVRKDALFCATLSRGETIEVDHEWDRHRWADWTDRDLARAGIRPEAYDRYRRATQFTLWYAPCEDTVAGHTPVSDDEAALLGMRPSQCAQCGHVTAP